VIRQVEKNMVLKEFKGRAPDDNLFFRRTVRRFERKRRLVIDLGKIEASCPAGRVPRRKCNPATAIRAYTRARERPARPGDRSFPQPIPGFRPQNFV